VEEVLQIIKHLDKEHNRLLELFPKIYIYNKQLIKENKELKKEIIKLKQLYAKN
jgi:hypothetical protein